MADRPSSTPLVAIAFAVWLAEWILGVSRYLGRVGAIVDLLWFALFVYFVIASRLRIPRAVHLWAWMTGLLVISVLRSWWIGWTTDSLGLFAELARRAPEVRTGLSSTDLAIIDRLVDAMVVGLVAGVVGALEASIIAVASWAGDRFRADRKPPRVDLLPRVCVVALQAPIFLVMMGFGLAAIGGTAELATHTAQPGDHEIRAQAVWILASGVAAWALATLILGRWLALARGGVVNRVLLAAIGVASAAYIIVGGGARSIGSIVGPLIWLALQLAAIRWARPNAEPPAVKTAR